MTTIIQEINRIIKVIEARPDDFHFVCNHAEQGPYGTEIKQMGRSNQP